MALHDHSDVPDDLALRVEPLQSLVVERGNVDEATIDGVIDAYEHRFGAHSGAAVVTSSVGRSRVRPVPVDDGTSAVNDIDVGARVRARLIAVGMIPWRERLVGRRS